jgi:hypothetical protein
VYAESGQEAGEVGTAKGNKYRQILSLKTVHILAFFLLVYVGTEVSGELIQLWRINHQLDTLPDRLLSEVRIDGLIYRISFPIIFIDVRLDRDIHYPGAGWRE